MTQTNSKQFKIDIAGKAQSAPIQDVVELADGDLLIEGWGANYDLDRENESFVEGAFTRGMKKFLEGPAPLNYHHKMDVNLGKVIGLEPVEGKGIKLRAIVRNQPVGSPLRHIYEGVKSGGIGSLSVGGIFERMFTDQGPKISDVDILEWSVTPVSVGKGTNFSVIAGKAVAELVEDVVEAPAEEPVVEPVVDKPEDEVVETPEGDEKPEPVEEDESTESTDPKDPDPEAAEVDDPETPEDIPLVKGENIAPGSIGVSHLSDELRSSFSELKPEAPTVEALAARLDEVYGRLEGYYAQQEVTDENTDTTL